MVQLDSIKCKPCIALPNALENTVFVTTLIHVLLNFLNISCAVNDLPDISLLQDIDINQSLMIGCRWDLVGILLFTFV